MNKIYELDVFDVDYGEDDAAESAEPVAGKASEQHEPASAEPLPEFVPTGDSTDRDFLSDVAYSIRGPRDVVLSGPITCGWGPGRWYASRRAAKIAMIGKYGAARVTELPGMTKGRWAFLIRDLKEA